MSLREWYRFFRLGGKSRTASLCSAIGILRGKPQRWCPERNDE